MLAILDSPDKQDALPETIHRFESLEPSDDRVQGRNRNFPSICKPVTRSSCTFPPVYSNFRTSVAKIYFDSNALPSIDPRVPHSILLLLRLDIILDAECSAHLPTLCLPQTPANASAVAELEEAQERFFDPLMATLAHTVLAQDYPLVFSAAKIKNFVWVLEWVQVTVDSLHNVYRRASCPREKARMTSYIQVKEDVLIKDCPALFYLFLLIRRLSSSTL